MTPFAPAEYAARRAAAQAGMAGADLGALLLTTEADIRYFTGFYTRFWESPTRPWFLVLPAEGAPLAVIPEIGAALMARTGITDIRTWPAPRREDDGISLLAASLREAAAGGRIAVPMGPETHLRMPLEDFHALQERVRPLRFVPDHGLVARLRAIKSEAEIARIATTCATAGRAFARLAEIARPGVSLRQVFRDFQRLCLQEGADAVPYLAGAAGALGYADVISPATDLPLARGDVLMLDTGAVQDGYFCDFDRNVAIGPPDPRAFDGYKRLVDAAQAGLEAARPGLCAADLHAVIQRICGPVAGRLGHGLGMQLTEGLSLLPDDRTELRPGMVLTLEPSVDMPDGGIMVHEENIVLTQTGARLLSPAAPPELPVLA